MANRTCTVRGNGGALIVRLTVTNLLNAGARFILVDSAEKVRSEWTMEPGEDAVDQHELTGFSPNDLRGFYIKWRIRTCSRHPQTETGTVTVDVLQDGAVAPMAPPGTWTPKVPQCSSGTAFRITDFCDLVIQ